MNTSYKHVCPTSQTGKEQQLLTHTLVTNLTSLYLHILRLLKCLSILNTTLFIRLLQGRCAHLSPTVTN